MRFLDVFTSLKMLTFINFIFNTLFVPNFTRVFQNKPKKVPSRNFYLSINLPWFEMRFKFFLPPGI